MSPIVPKNEGPTTPVSLRVPEVLLSDLRGIAKETGNTLAETMVHMLRWARDETRRQQLDERRAITPREK